MLKPPLRAFAALVAVVSSVTLVISAAGAWPANSSALVVAGGSLEQDGCAPAGYKLARFDGSTDAGWSSYLRAWASAASASPDGFPSEAEWGRDPRLFHWFKAQLSIAQGKPAESLFHLRSAQAAGAVDSSGHAMYWGGDVACAVFNWLLAEEISERRIVRSPEAAAWARSQLTPENAGKVVDTYSKALAFQPARDDWRLMLARALLVLDRFDDARATLQPVLNGSGEEKSEAQRILDEYLAGRKPAP